MCLKVGMATLKILYIHFIFWLLFDVEIPFPPDLVSVFHAYNFTRSALARLDYTQAI